MLRALLFLAVVCIAPLTVANERFIIVQSTTSTQNSGLFGHLIPRFRAAAGIDVRVVAVGTGQALKNARNGDGDVLLVHAKADEEAFVAQGYGVERFDIMYNDFVVVGPQADPAGVRGLTDAPTAFAHRLSHVHQLDRFGAMQTLMRLPSQARGIAKPVLEWAQP